jgi:hypothetical protein
MVKRPLKTTWFHVFTQPGPIADINVTWESNASAFTQRPLFGEGAQSSLAPLLSIR